MFAELGIIELAVIALWAYCVFDCIRTDDSMVQNLPKIIWLLIVILFPPIGPLAWLLLGRPARGEWRLRTNAGPRPARDVPPPPVADPRPSAADHQARREEALRRYEEEREAKRREEERRKGEGTGEN